MTPRILVPLLCSLFMLHACDKQAPMPAQEPTAQNVTPAEPQVPQDTEPPVMPDAPAAPTTPPDPAAAALAVDAFSTKTLGALLEAQKTPENLFYSPYSLFTALAMTSAGASGDTLTQMQGVLGVSDHADVSALSEALEPKHLPEEHKFEGAGDPMTLNVANRVWVASDLEPTATFAGIAKTHYGTTPEGIDFAESGAATATINDWIAAATNDQIKDVLSPGMIDSLTKLVLVNAVYFKASWTHVFDPNMTKAKPFTTQGKTTKVPTMHLTKDLPYFELNGLAQVVTLPYEGGAQMVVLLPNKGKFDAVRKRLVAEGPSLFTPPEGTPESASSIDLALPRFSVRSKLSLSDMLRSLGLTDPFDDQKADFSAMVTAPPSTGLFIKSVIQEAMVKTSETGTEAAAATVVMMATRGMIKPPKPIAVHVDRPFFVLVRHTSPGIPLFVGQIISP